MSHMSARSYSFGICFGNRPNTDCFEGLLILIGRMKKVHNRSFPVLIMLSTSPLSYYFFIRYAYYYSIDMYAKAPIDIYSVSTICLPLIWSNSLVFTILIRCFLYSIFSYPVDLKSVFLLSYRYLQYSSVWSYKTLFPPFCHE